MEKDVLSQCMRDEGFARAASPVLRAHSFSNRHHTWIWRVLSETYAATRELPTGRVYAAHLLRDFERPEDRAYLLGVLKGLYGRPSKAPRSALEEVRRFARVAAVRGSLGDALDALDKSDVDGAERAVETGLSATRAASALREPATGDAWAERLRIYTGEDGPTVRFDVPIDAFNRVTGGGLPPGAVAIVVAQTNIGKSTWAVDVGYTALLRNPATHVAHVTTEETEREAFARYDSRIAAAGEATAEGKARFERTYLLSGALSPHDAEAFRVRMTRAKALTSRLHVLELAPGSSSSGLWSFVERVREQAGPDAPILLNVDSPDHLEPPTAAARKDHRLQVAAVYWNLKALAKDKRAGPLAVWAVTWAPAEYEHRRMTANAVSETKEKGRIADFMLAMTDGDSEGDASSEAGDQEIIFDVIKNRLGRVKRLRVYARANLGVCEFRDSERRASGSEGD
jgi:hypothetical protein